MKILIVSQYFWPEFFLVNDLATELSQRGHEVTVLTGLPNYPRGKLFEGYSFWKGPWREKFGRVSVRRVPLIPRRAGFFWLGVNYISFIFFGMIPGLFQIPKSIDLVFCFGLSPVTSCIPAIAIKSFKKLPLIFWVQDLWPESVIAVKATESRWAVSLIGAMTRWIYRRCDQILMQSEAFRPSILKWGGRESQLKFVPNWFTPAVGQWARPAWLPQQDQAFKVVFAGNLGQAQALGSVLRAAEILRSHQNIHWLIVGDGSVKDWLEKEIIRAKLKDQVHTFGRRPVEDMPALFAHSDLLLVTLTAEPIFALTIPTKIQAYLSSGKPILAAMNGEGARIIEEARAGLTCAAEDAEAIAALVLKMSLMTSEQRREMGQNGRNYFEKNFEPSLVIEKIETICESMVNKRNL